MPATLTVPEIDFLPLQYREQELNRRSHGWRVIVVAGFAGVLIVTTVYLWTLQARARAELDRITQLHAEATARAARLGELNAKLEPVISDAELVTYLRHPWPRSQLIAAIAAPQPSAVQLSKLHLTREAIVRPAAATAPPVSPTVAAENKQLPTKPAAQDLRKLKADCDEFRTDIVIEGTTGEAAALHEYLHELGRNPLFAKVELGLLQALPASRPSSATANAATAGFKFTARITVRPGYGQPSGPVPAKRAQHSSIATVEHAERRENVSTPNARF